MKSNYDFLTSVKTLKVVTGIVKILQIVVQVNWYIIL